MGVAWRYQNSGTPTMIDDSVADITCSINSNPAAPMSGAFVGVHWAESVATDVPVTCSYGGVAMTEVADTGAGPFLNVFKLFNPPRGSQTVLVTFVGGTSLFIAAALSVVTFTGTNATESVQNTSGTSTTPSATTVLSAGSAAISFYTVDLIAGASTGTVGSGETQRVNRTAGAAVSTNFVRALVSTQAAGGDGVMNYSLSASRVWYETAFGLVAGGSSRGIISGGMVPTAI